MFTHSRSIAAASLAAACFFTAAFAPQQAVPTPPPTPTSADVPRIGTREFMRLHETGGALAVDVRSAEVFRLGRVGGAIHVPLDQIAGRATEIRERAGGRVIVTYCSCTAELSSAEAGRRLMAAGAANVRALVGGYPEWVLAGGRVER